MEPSWTELCDRLTIDHVCVSCVQGVGPQEYTLIKMKVVEPFTARFKSKVFFSR